MREGVRGRVRVRESRRGGHRRWERGGVKRVQKIIPAPGEAAPTKKDEYV